MLNGLMLRIKEKLVKTPLEKHLYSGLMDILRDREFYYQSGINRDYSKLTDVGKEAVLEYISILAPYMLEREQTELDNRAKKLIIDGLKS